jgi:eukaryotic-like serine/threonine-protein kinase
MLLILAAIAQAATLTLGALDLRWVVALDTPPAATPAYDQESAYVPLRNGTLVAVDLNRGRITWRREVASAVAPSVGDGFVFVAGAAGVEALSAAGGQTRWRTPIPGRLLTVTWDNGWLLCSNDAGDLAALRATDGELIWRASLGSALVLPPAAGLDRVYLALDGGQVLSLDLQTGVRSWARSLEGRITGMRAANGQLVVGTTANAVFSLDLASGRQRWRWRVGGDVVGPAASDDKHVYFASRDNILRSVDIRSGNLRWTADLPARPVGGPQVLAGRVVVPLSTSVGLFDPRNGKPDAPVTVSGEMSAAPHLRAGGRPTSPRLVAIALDGRMQGFGWRFEAPPVPLAGLPGVPVPPD